MGERGGKERERERDGERGRVVKLLLKEVCEGQLGSVCVGGGCKQKESHTF